MMRPRALALCLLAAVLALSARPLYPISPHGLRRLFLGAELVVVADVIHTEPLDPEEPFGASTATLAVSRCLKGEADGGVVEVDFSWFGVCTQPARYAQGETVLAFLTPKADASGYRTFALNYGKKSLTQSGLQVYVERIEELERVLAVADADERDEQTVEWMLRCVEHPATRVDGYLDLTQWRGLQARARPGAEVGSVLSDAQIQRLVVLLASSGPGVPPRASMIMSLVSKATGQPAFKEIERRYGELGWRDPQRDAKQQQLVTAFVQTWIELSRTQEQSR